MTYIIFVSVTCNDRFTMACFYHFSPGRLFVLLTSALSVLNMKRMLAILFIWGCINDFFTLYQIIKSSHSEKLEDNTVSRSVGDFTSYVCDFPLTNSYNDEFYLCCPETFFQDSFLNTSKNNVNYLHSSGLRSQLCKEDRRRFETLTWPIFDGRGTKKVTFPPEIKNTLNMIHNYSEFQNFFNFASNLSRVGTSKRGLCLKVKKQQPNFTRSSSREADANSFVTFPPPNPKRGMFMLASALPSDITTEPNIFTGLPDPTTTTPPPST